MAAKIIDPYKSFEPGVKMGHSRSLYFRLFISPKIPNGWIRTRFLLCRKRPLCQLFGIATQAAHLENEFMQCCRSTNVKSLATMDDGMTVQLDFGILKELKAFKLLPLKCLDRPVI